MKVQRCSDNPWKLRRCPSNEWKRVRCGEACNFCRLAFQQDSPSVVRLTIANIPPPPPRPPAPAGGGAVEAWQVIGTLNGTWDLQRRPSLEIDEFGNPLNACTWSTPGQIAVVNYQRYRRVGFPPEEEILENSTCSVWHYITIQSFLSFDGPGVAWRLGHHQNEDNLPGCEYVPGGPPFPPGTATLGADTIDLQPYGRCSPLNIVTATEDAFGEPGGGVDWAPTVPVTWRLETFT